MSYILAITVFVVSSFLPQVPPTIVTEKPTKIMLQDDPLPDICKWCGGPNEPEKCTCMLGR